MTILFMCSANSVRSQLAEGLARKYLPEYSIVSAGAGKSHVNSTVISVLESEEGIDASSHYSKSVDEIDKESIDLTIAVCTESVIPTSLLKKEYLIWPFSVPHDRSETIKLAQEIKAKILELKSSMNP